MFITSSLIHFFRKLLASNFRKKRDKKFFHFLCAVLSKHTRACNGTYLGLEVWYFLRIFFMVRVDISWQISLQKPELPANPASFFTYFLMQMKNGKNMINMKSNFWYSLVINLKDLYTKDLKGYLECWLNLIVQSHWTKIPLMSILNPIAGTVP